MSDEANLIGKGREILLPPRGNPFKKESAAGEPKDLSPAEIAARFGGASDETTARVGGADEPSDLSPADIAALFPSTADERNVIPSMEASRAHAANLDSDVPPSLSPDEVGAMLAEQPAGTPPPLPPRPSARAKTSFETMAATSAARDDDAHIDITAFNPDAPIGEPRVLSSETVTAPVDISAFNPDAPAGMTAPAATPGVGFKPFDPFAPAAETAAEPQPAAVAAVAVSAASAPGDVAAVVSVAASAAPSSDILSASLSKHDTFHGGAITLVPEQDSMVSMLITNDRVDQLWDRIEAAERAAVADSASLRERRVDNLECLKIARNLLLGGRKNYEDALRYVVEVEADLLYAARVRKWSNTWGMAILAYNLLWIMLLFIGYFTAGRIVEPFAASGTVDQQFGFVLWVTILAGGLGGVSKSLFSLVTHITQQDFDTQHSIWYWTCPLIGAVLGIFVIAFTQLGLTSLGVNVGSSTNGSLVSYALAWVVGFQQNLVLELVERVKKLILPDKNKEKQETPPGS